MQILKSLILKKTQGCRKSEKSFTETLCHFFENNMPKNYSKNFIPKSSFQNVFSTNHNAIMYCIKYFNTLDASKTAKSMEL